MASESHRFSVHLKKFFGLFVYMLIIGMFGGNIASATTVTIYPEADTEYSLDNGVNWIQYINQFSGNINKTWVNSPRTATIALGSGYPTNAYKGNTHTHSNDSVDAPTRTPEHTINHYAGMGYSFLALTEHNNFNTTLNQYNNASFIVLEAEENSATTDGGQHINVFNITHITSSTTFTKQQLINNVTSSGGLVFLNHPNWGGNHYTLAQMLTLQNYTGIEIYGVGGNAIAKWDSLLMTGRHIFGSSVDDSHDDSRDGFRWINVFASSLTNNTIISAIRDGKFYSVRGDYKNGSIIDMNIYPFEINNYSMGSTLNFIYGNVTSNVTINSTETIDTIQLIRINSTDSRVIASKINCAATLCNWVYSLTPTDTQENSTYRLYAKTKKTELWSNPIWLNRGYGLTGTIRGAVFCGVY